MITTELKGKILYMKLEGEYSSDEIVSASREWYIDHFNEFAGCICDITDLTSHPAMEQRKTEAFNKKLPNPKPRAIISSSPDGERFTNTYVRFTKAEKMKYFPSAEEAEKWILSEAQ